MKRLLIMAFLLSFLLVGCREPKQEVMKKPVIYLYPEFTQEVEVKLDYAGELTCTYPEYKDGWHIVAHPNGMLESKENGKEYSYLFWEGNAEIEYDLSKGYVIAGEDTADFLEKKLSELGLNRAEANEFIVYWLPSMQGNKYNLITFQNEIYTEAAKLEITPKPDSILRVFMAYKPLDEFMEIEVNTPDGNRQFDRASPTPLPLKSYTLSAGPTPSV